MHDYVKTLGTVIRKAREEQGLSQASLAEKLGIDVRTIINIENFRGNPKFEVLYPLITTFLGTAQLQRKRGQGHPSCCPVYYGTPARPAVRFPVIS
mgnify:CR=1 FL=1